MKAKISCTILGLGIMRNRGNFQSNVCRNKLLYYKSIIKVNVNSIVHVSGRYQSVMLWLSLKLQVFIDANVSSLAVFTFNITFSYDIVIQKWTSLKDFQLICSV
jgi:hypothetical protein